MSSSPPRHAWPEAASSVMITGLLSMPANGLRDRCAVTRVRPAILAPPPSPGQEYPADERPCRIAPPKLQAQRNHHRKQERELHASTERARQAPGPCGVLEQDVGGDLQVPDG